MPEAFATAYLNLFLEGKIQLGDTLLITGGNSGLASVTIPLAKAFGISQNTASVRLSRMRGQLKDYLNKEGYYA